MREWISIKRILFQNVFQHNFAAIQCCTEKIFVKKGKKKKTQITLTSLSQLKTADLDCAVNMQEMNLFFFGCTQSKYFSN